MSMQFTIYFSAKEVDHLLAEYDTKSLSELQDALKEDMRDHVLENYDGDN